MENTFLLYKIHAPSTVNQSSTITHIISQWTHGPNGLCEIFTTVQQLLLFRLLKSCLCEGGLGGSNKSWINSQLKFAG